MEKNDDSNKNLWENVPRRSVRKSTTRKENIYIKIIVLIICLIIIVGVVSFYFMQQKDRGPQLDESAIEYTIPEAPKNEESSEILVPYFSKITTDINGQGQAILLNPEGNPCYFVYKLILSDSEEVIYESGLIKPGMAITDWKLNTKLNPGEYGVKLEVETFQLEDITQKANGASSIITLVVEE